jgi:deoxyribonuclease V
VKIEPAPHGWSVSPAEAAQIQRTLASRIRQRRLRAAARLVAGVDAAFSPDGRSCIAAAVVWDAQRRITVEQYVAVRRVRFPYVPGLLSFRETPALIAALRKLRTEPDVVICDAHGIAHPRRFGLACHVGILCRRPTIGCAKSRLVGTHDEPGWAHGAAAPLRDSGEVVGAAVRTRAGVRPVYVSVGHLIDLRSALRVVLDCAVGYRLPEPTRLADHLAARAGGDPTGISPSGRSPGGSSRTRATSRSRNAPTNTVPRPSAAASR